MIAIVLAGLILGGCSGPRFSNTPSAGADPEYARLSRLARAAYDRGSFAQAETLYRHAFNRARALDAAAGIGEAAYNLAAVLITRGRPGDAWPLLEEAEAELSRSGQPPVEVWLTKAKLAAAEHRADDALRWVAQVESQAGLRPAHRVDVALLRGRLACDEPNVTQARDALETARQQIPLDAPALAAGIEHLSGRLLLLEGRPLEAGAAFDGEAELCRRAGQHRAMGQALARAGEAFARAGEARGGAERIYRAARSFLALGDIPAARRLIAQSEQLAREGGDPALLGRIGALAAEAERAQP